MFCSSCGSAVSPGLSYCNRCGFELGLKQRSRNKLDMPLESLVWAIVTVAVVGLGANIGLMALLKQALHFEDGLILGISMVAFLPFLAIEAAFIWLLLRSQLGSARLGDLVPSRVVDTNNLDKPERRELDGPAPSITEHTTRGIAELRVKRD